MPSSSEMGLLRGLGQGMADIGKMGFAAELQRMRDERLAKIEAQAADKRWTRDKELLSIRGEQDRENASFKVDEEVRGKKELGEYYLGKGLNPDGSAPKQADWEIIKDDMGRPAGLSNGQSMINFDTPYGREVKKNIDAGVPIGDAMDSARIRLREIGSGQNQQQDEPGFFDRIFGGNSNPPPPERGAQAQTEGDTGYIPGSQGPEPTPYQRKVADEGYFYERVLDKMGKKRQQDGLLKGGTPSGVF